MSLAAFAAIYSLVVVAPLISQISSEFGITTGAVGPLVAAYSLPGILSALVIGPYSDRLGRRPFLIGGALVAGGFTILSAFAPNYSLLVIARALAGVGAAAVIPSAMATVADHFPYRERGSAVASVFAANTLGQLTGVAVAGIIAERLGWRTSLGLSGLFLVLAAMVVFLVVPKSSPMVPGDLAAAASYLRVLRFRSAVALLGSILFGLVAWGTWTTFIVVFLQFTFGLSQGVASTYALVVGAGQLIGSQVGGRLGDRVGQRLVVAVAMPFFGLILLVIVSGAVPLLVAVGLQLLAAVAFGMRSTSNVALLTEQVPSARGTMMALGGVIASASTVIGTSVGGLLVDQSGFGAVAVFCSICAIASGVVVLRLVVEPTSSRATA